MTQKPIGYARCSTDKQDLAAHEGIPVSLGVAVDHIHTGRGFTSANRARPGLDQALADLGEGGMLVVPKLDRLARSVVEVRDIADHLAACGGKRQLGNDIPDPAYPIGKLRGKKPKLSTRHQQELRRMHDTGEYSVSGPAGVSSISRPAVYRTLGWQAA